MNLSNNNQLSQTLLAATRRVKSIKFSRGLLTCTLLALLAQTAELSLFIRPVQAADTCAIGSPCLTDPACVVVGNTHILEWKSKTPAKIVVICIHGLGLCAMAYKPLAKQFSDAGIDGYGINVRGFGPDRDKADRAKLNCIDTVSDIGKLLVDIHKQYPDYKVFLVGESMGGALALRAAAENADLVDGVVCSAPAWKLLKMRSTAVKGIFELYLFHSRRPGIASRGVIKQATSDRELAEHWLTGSSHKMKLTRKEAFDFVRFVSKTDSYAKKIEMPVLVMQGLDDHLVSPKAVAELFGDMPARSKEFLIDAKGEHLLLEEGNFSPALIEKLISWLKADHSSDRSPTLITMINEQSLSTPEAHRLQRLLKVANNNYADGNYTVCWTGAVKNVHQGLDFSGKIALSPLAELPHLYAVGPLANLRGEVTIWDGKPLIARVISSQVKVGNDLRGKACFLVYASVERWQTTTLSSAVTASEIDQIVKNTATKCGINVDQPFPFLIEGVAKSARYHVMNRTESTPPSPGPESHEKAKVRFTIEDNPVSILGFYSEHHQGIFTHHSSFVHMHVKAGDDKIAGHLETIELEPGARLLLPLVLPN
jgi:acetolactate decarboxylase